MCINAHGERQFTINYYGTQAALSQQWKYNERAPKSHGRTHKQVNKTALFIVLRGSTSSISAQCVVSECQVTPAEATLDI